ncbi:hypothetical protein [Rhodococcus indonesiensis]
MAPTGESPGGATEAPAVAEPGAPGRGLRDRHPFVLPTHVSVKMWFVHELIVARTG